MAGAPPNRVRSEEAGPVSAPSRRTDGSSLLRRRHDLAGSNQLLDLGRLLDDHGSVLQLRADLAEADAAVLDAEHLVEAGTEAARVLLKLLRGQDDGF